MNDNRQLNSLTHLDQILERHDRRQSTRIAEFPPDFRHGEATLDELYEAFGEEWVEGAAFVQHHCGPDGRPYAVSIATFTDWFLRVEHVTLDDHETLDAQSLQRWMHSRLNGRRVVLELQTEPHDVRAPEGSHWLDLQCSFGRLLELERSVLHVARDGEHDWATSAQTNLLSLITLCARLGVDRLN